MTSLPKILSSAGLGFFYERSPRHVTHTFNQDGQALYRNHPRLPFEYYVTINLDRGSSGDFISKFLKSTEPIEPLVKSVEMPSMKIETAHLNQYNRKRIVQTNIAFEPIKMVFHDVVDGKTLKFWDMYYRYYFRDGMEPGKNETKNPQPGNKTAGAFNVETMLKDLGSRMMPKINPAITSLPSSVQNLFKPKASPTGVKEPMNMNGQKSDIDNIVKDKLDNHNFGFNLTQVAEVRNIIQSIDIYQVHGGRFNKVTLVNPRIAAFTHDVLNYANTERTLELTFSFEYEYAYYTIQNLKLGEGGSSKEPFSHGDTVELPALAFNTALMDFVESNNPLLQSDNPILRKIGKNVQTSIGSVTGAFASKVTRSMGTSVLSGLANLSPGKSPPAKLPEAKPRSFASAAPSSRVNPQNSSTPGIYDDAAPYNVKGSATIDLATGKRKSLYTDVNRTGGNPGA